MRWLKNTSGVQDSMLTFAVGGFLVTAIAIIVSLLDSFTFGEFVLKFSKPDTAMVVAFLGGTLLAYVSRRNKKDDIAAKEKELKIKEGIY